MALSGKNRFAEVKKYMEAVEKMIKYDVDQVAKTRGITVESTYYNTWTAAYMDSLVNEEIIYLERLAAVPTYLKADIFIRLSMIYSDRKDYEKALDYLEKGKVKIPQRASEFLEQQINIELSRNNHAIILAKFTEAIANNPDNANYYFSRVVTYHQLKLNELESQEAAYKRGDKVPASKYSFKQCLTDYTKAISLDNSNFDALNNEAVAIFDSANYMYKQMTKVSASEFDRYKTSASGLYRLSMSKFEVLKQSGFLKGEDYINLLKDMKTCAARTGNVEERNKLDDLIKSEKAKLEGVGK
jgi:tetratricopeptide (TPR) repeat protein